MFDSILKLLKAFFAICCFKIAPQDLPSSRVLLQVTLAAFSILSLLVANVRFPPAPALLLAITTTLFLVAFTLAALKVRRLPNRTTQTLTAQAGSGALLTVLGLPIMYWATTAPVPPDQLSAAAVLWHILLAWSLMVQGYIFRHALSTNWTVGVVIALISYWILLTLLGAIMPVVTRT